MTTKVISYPDYRDIEVDPNLLVVEISEEEVDQEVERELYRIVKKNGSIEDADEEHEITEEDIVMLKVSSKIPKFNKPLIPVTVGKGLFDLELENSLIGMKKNEEKSIELQGESVNIKILKIKTRSLPSLTFEMIKEELPEDMDYIQSIEDFKKAYKEDVIQMYRQEYIGKAHQEIRDKIISQLKIEIDEKELEKYETEVMNSILKEAKEDAIPIKEYMRSLFEEGDEIKDEEIESKVKENIFKDFQLFSYAKEILKNEEIDTSVETYEQAIKSWVQESGLEESAIKEEMPYQLFVDKTIMMEMQTRIVEFYMEKQQVKLV